MTALVIPILVVALGVFELGYVEEPAPRPCAANGRAWVVSQAMQNVPETRRSVAVYVAPEDGTRGLEPSWTADGVLDGNLHVSPGGRMLVVLALTFREDVLAEVYWEGRRVREIRADELFGPETLGVVGEWERPFAEAGGSFTFRGVDDVVQFRLLTRDGPGSFTIDVANGLDWLTRPEPPVVAEAPDEPSDVLREFLGRPPSGAALGVAFVLTLLAGGMFGALFVRWRQDVAERGG